jgi:phosphate starvation-inducible membrane PsiE
MRLLMYLAVVMLASYPSTGHRWLDYAIIFLDFFLFAAMIVYAFRNKGS